MQGKWVLAQDGTLLNLDHVARIYISEWNKAGVSVMCDIGTGTGEQWNPVTLCAFDCEANKYSKEMDEEGHYLLLPNPSYEAAKRRARQVITSLVKYLGAISGEKGE